MELKTLCQLYKLRFNNPDGLQMDSHIQPPSAGEGKFERTAGRVSTFSTSRGYTALSPGF